MNEMKLDVEGLKTFGGVLVVRRRKFSNTKLGSSPNLEVSNYIALAREYIGVSTAMAKNPTAIPITIIITGSMIEDISLVC